MKYLDVLSPDFGNEIIAAACVLHNFILLNDPGEEEEFEDDNMDDIFEGVDERQEDVQIAAQKRLQIVNMLRN